MFSSIVKPQGFCRVGKTPCRFCELLTKPGSVGFGMYCNKLAETGLKQAVGIMFPLNGVPGMLPLAVQPLWTGSKISVCWPAELVSALKSPAFSAGVGNENVPVCCWFWRYHSILKWKNVLFLPL